MVFVRARSAVTFSLLVLGAAAGLVPACVGDDPVGTTSSDAGTSPTGTGTGTTTAPPDGSTPPPSDAGSDGAVACPSGFAECDDDPKTVCETDTRTNAAHCGKCKRACGGAALCQAGECQAEKLADGLQKPVGLALAGPRLVWYEGDIIRGCRADDCNASKIVLVDVTGSATNFPTGLQSPRQIYVEGSNFYFSQCPSGSNSDCRIAACDVGGCKLTGATFLAPANGDRRAAWVMGGGGQIFSHQGLDGLYRTDIAAKTQTYENGKYRIGDQLQAAAITGQRFVFLDDNASLANPTGGLFVCPVSGCTAAPTRLLPPPVKHLSIAGDTAFVATGGAAAATASIIGCDTAGCAGSGNVLATNQAYVSDIAATDDAVYWATVGAQLVETNSTPVGTVMRCAKPCTGGPQKLAESLINPVSVLTDATYVYWLVRGTAVGANGSVWRKRR
jgi:hypothetical protein